MRAERPQALTPPEGLRPAQLGIVLLGRVIVGHASATLVDLAQRGLIAMEQVRGHAGADWVLTDLGGQVVPGTADMAADTGTMVAGTTQDSAATIAVTDTTLTVSPTQVGR